MEALKRLAYELLGISDEALVISISVLILVSVTLVVYWLYNRRKFRELSHQIPASVVKNYLDSIIQNSSALKSSLFRGGGFDIGEGIPSVMPIQNLESGDVSLTSVGSIEEVNQKNAEIALLREKLVLKENLIKDLERKVADAPSGGGAVISSGPVSSNSGDTEVLKKEIEHLKGELIDAQTALVATDSGGDSSAGDTSGLQDELALIKAERDELKERLREYEIIEEDLANLKRFQQENIELKNQIAALQGGGTEESGEVAVEASVEEVAPAAESVAEIEEPAEEEEIEDMAAAMAAEAQELEKEEEESVAEIQEPVEEEIEDMAEALAAEAQAPAEEAAVEESVTEDAAEESVAAEPVAEPKDEVPEMSEEAVAELSEAAGESELDVPEEEGEQKSAEELLSEFEKMLG